MIKIINDLRVFFEDCYRRINIREYAKLMKISPPTASSLLNAYHKEGLLNKEEDRRFHFFYANKENKQFRDLSRLYWYLNLHEFTTLLEKELNNPTIILFGSLSKAEAKIDSDIDIAVCAQKKELHLKPIEDKLKRNIQLTWFSKLKDIKNKHLANNIINGYIIRGKITI